MTKKWSLECGQLKQKTDNGLISGSLDPVGGYLLAIIFGFILRIKVKVENIHCYHRGTETQRRVESKTF